MLGFSAAAMNAYQNGSPSALEGEAEQTRDVPTANLCHGLVDRAKVLQQTSAWEGKKRTKPVVLKDTMQSLAEAARLVGRGMRERGRAVILEAAKDPDVAATGRSREAPPNIVSGALLTPFLHRQYQHSH